MDREAWRDAIHGVSKSRTQLSNWTEYGDSGGRNNSASSYSVFHYLITLLCDIAHTCVCVCPYIILTTNLSKWKSLSRVWLFATPWIVACPASLSMDYSRPDYWSGLPFPSPGDLPNPGIEPRSSALQVDSLPSEPPGKPHNKPRMRLSSLFLFYIWNQDLQSRWQSPDLSPHLSNLRICVFNR